MEFEQVDIALAKFKDRTNAKISTKPHSDWLIFEYRKVSWLSKSKSCQIEILPNFDHNEEIASWTLCCSAYHSGDPSSGYVKREIAAFVPLKFIADNINLLLNDCDDFFSGLS